VSFLVRREYEIECPIGTGRAAALLAYCDQTIAAKKAVTIADVLTKIAAGTLVTLLLRRAEAPELVMFFDEAIAQKLVVNYRAALVRMTTTIPLVIKLQTPP
jgi:hypothetical protein